MEQLADNGEVYAKSALINGCMLIIDSINMLYSSWGEKGVTEYSLAANAPAAFRSEDCCLLLFYAVTRSIKFQSIPIPDGFPAPQKAHNSWHNIGQSRICRALEGFE